VQQHRLAGSALDKGADRGLVLLPDDQIPFPVPGTLPFSGTKTKAEYLQVVRRIEDGFPDGLTFTVGDCTQQGDRVESEGKHVNGKTYANKYHFLFVVQGGKIVSVKEYMDTLHLHDLITG